MVTGAHVVIYTRDAEADRAFLRDVLRLPHVDAGDGWLIFSVPPAVLAFHPGDRNEVHELYLVCEDVETLVHDMDARGVTCTGIEDRGLGRLTRVTLPGGGAVGVRGTRARADRGPRTSCTSPGASSPV